MRNDEWKSRIIEEQKVAFIIPPTGGATNVSIVSSQLSATFNACLWFHDFSFDYPRFLLDFFVRFACVRFVSNMKQQTESNY